MHYPTLHLTLHGNAADVDQNWVWRHCGGDGVRRKTKELNVGLFRITKNEYRFTK